MAFVLDLDVIVVPPVFALIFEVFHAEKFPWKIIPSRLAVLTITAILSVGVLHLLEGSIVWVGVINVLIMIDPMKWVQSPAPVASGVSLMPLSCPRGGEHGGSRSALSSRRAD